MASAVRAGRQLFGVSVQIYSTMAEISGSLRDRFRGCMLGGVCGDCLGSLFECSHWDITIPVTQVVKGLSPYISIEGTSLADAGQQGSKPKVLKYTDDTAMAFTLARSLLENGALRERYLAKSFAHEFEREPDRGYGGSVITVFDKLLAGDSCSRDVFKPAQEQFDGSGSFGNGAGMRASPVALFATSQQELAEVASLQGLLTHAHPDGVCGGVLQASAVRYALLADREAVFDCSSCLDYLEQTVKDFFLRLSDSVPDYSPLNHLKHHNARSDVEQVYLGKLAAIRSLLADEKSNQLDVAAQIGTGIAASEAVPAAIFSALRSFCLENERRHAASRVNDVTREWVTGKASDCNLMKETVLYSISLGGDTDTIACMAGGIVGAYCGAESIDASWHNVCEGYTDAIELGDKFYARHEETSSA